MVLIEKLVDLEKNEEKIYRIKKAKEDFFFFCKYYLPDAFPTEFAEYQKILIEIIQKRKITKQQIEQLKKFIKPDYHTYLREIDYIEGILDAEPRDHGKTTRMTQAFPLWLAVTQKNVFPVIIGASLEMAADSFLDSIRYEIENNERIKEDFGELKGRIWKRNKIILKNGNAIGAVGSRGSIRGIKDRYRRPTHIICDDLLKEDEVESKKEREKLYIWFKRTVMNLGKGALIIIVNTIMHPADLISRLFDEVKEGQLEKWVGIRLRAIRPDGKPLWPQRWNIKALEQKRKELGSIAFSTEWLNEPLEEGSKKFRREWFKYFDLSDIDWTKLHRVMAVDPATGKETGDYSAIVVVGKKEGEVYVLYADGWKISDLEFIRKIIDVYKTWKPHEIRFETITFQEIYKNDLLREAMKEGIMLPVKGVNNMQSKEFRISKLSPLVEGGIIKFRKEQKLLLDQLDNFPKDNDDLPDALEMAIRKEPEPRIRWM